MTTVLNTTGSPLPVTAFAMTVLDDNNAATARATLGAAAAADLTAHQADTANPHAVSAAQAGADPTGSAAAAQAAAVAAAAADATAKANAAQAAAAADLSAYEGTAVTATWSTTGTIHRQTRSTHDLAAVDDLIATPEAGWSWKNAAKLASATIAASKLTLTGDGLTTSQWQAGAYTAPTYTTPIIRLPHGPIVFQGHMALDNAAAPASFEGIGAIIDAGEVDRYVWLGLHQHGAADTDNFRLKIVRGGNAELGATAGITRAQATTGFYWAMAVHPDGSIEGRYHLAAYTGPLAWEDHSVHLGFLANHFLPTDDSVDVGVYNMQHTATNAPVGSYAWLAIDRPEIV